MQTKIRQLTNKILIAALVMQMLVMPSLSSAETGCFRCERERLGGYTF